MNLRAGFGQDGVDFFPEVSPGHTVGGDAHGKHTARHGIALQHRHIMALLGQVIGGGHAAGARAHHSHLFAGGGQVPGFFLPAPLDVMLHGEAFQVPDGDGLVQTLALAALLTIVCTDIAQGVGEGHLLPDHGHRFIVLARADHTQIVGDVDVGGALKRAGNEVFLPGALVLFEHALLVLERPGGAHLHAGPAEAAVGLGQREVVQGAHVCLAGFLHPVVAEHLHPPHVGAHPYAPAALDTPDHVPVDQGVVGVEVHRLLMELPHTGVVHAGQVLLERLELTVPEGAAAGALGMAGHHHLHGGAADGIQRLPLGAYAHPLRRPGHAGGGGGVLPLDHHHTQLAAALSLQVGMRADVGDVNSGSQGGAEDALAFFRLNLDPVDP